MYSKESRFLDRLEEQGYSLTEAQRILKIRVGGGDIYRRSSKGPLSKILEVPSDETDRAHYNACVRLFQTVMNITDEHCPKPNRTENMLDNFLAKPRGPK